MRAGKQLHIALYRSSDARASPDDLKQNSCIPCLQDHGLSFPLVPGIAVPAVLLYPSATLLSTALLWCLAACTIVSTSYAATYCTVAFADHIAAR